MNYDKYIKELQDKHKEAFGEKFHLWNEYGWWLEQLLKSLQSHVKTIELVKEEFEGMIKDHEKGMELCKSHDNITMAVSHDGSIKALSQAITLLDTIIQDVKS
jgi:broad specificity phosphatase PhoE